MTDQLMKALAYEGQIRIFVVRATDLVNEARRRHGTWHTATAALGRTLVGTSLLAADLKNDRDKVSVEILGDGPLGRIVTDGDADGNIRGFVSNPEVALPLNEEGKLDVAGAVGLPGTFVVRKDLGLKEPFAGQVPLVSGEIAEDFTYYMAVSEQTPSSFGLSVLVNPDETVESAGGFMIQVLPDATDEVLTELENRLNNLGRLSAHMEENTDLETTLAYLVGENNYQILSQEPVRFACVCSKEVFAGRLLLLEESELQTLIEEDHGAEVLCHFCNEHYEFSQENLEELLALKQSQDKN